MPKDSELNLDVDDTLPDNFIQLRMNMNEIEKLCPGLKDEDYFRLEVDIKLTKGGKHTLKDLLGGD